MPKDEYYRMDNPQVTYKKPPDKFQVRKVPLINILRDSNDLSKLNSAIARVNVLTKDVYSFLKLLILQKYQTLSPGQKLPIIDNEYVKIIFKVLSQKDPKRGGRQLKESNLSTYNTLNNFYLTEFQPLTSHLKIDAINLSQILGYQSTKIVTAIESNIKSHFLKFLKRYVKIYCKSFYINQNLCFPTTINNEIYQVNRDLLTGSLDSDPKFHQWILRTRTQILPIQITTERKIITNPITQKLEMIVTDHVTTWVYDHKDLTVDPQRYLPSLISMNLKIEKLQSKLFKWLPSREDSIVGYIPIDTAILVGLLMIDNKDYYLRNITLHQDLIWNRFINMNDSIFRAKKFQFNYRIETDGQTSSVYLINNNDVEAERLKKSRLQEARKNTSELSDIERSQRKITLGDQRKQKKSLQLQAYSLLTQDQKDRLKEHNNTIGGVRYVELPYFNHLPKTKLDELKGRRIVFIDPGKRSLLTMMSRIDGNPIYLNYTNRQRMFETKRLKYQQLLANHRKKKGILDIESKLKTNGKSCQIDEFKNHVRERVGVQGQLMQLYSDPIFRQYRWYSYINTQRSEAKLLDRIASVFGSDAVIIIGDWQEHQQMKHFISTPGIGLKRLLNERFEVFQIDEFRTSCLHNKTEEKCSNLKLLISGRSRKLHPVLTYKMENNRYGCINRDKNAVLNMEKIYREYQVSGLRPEKYRRCVNLDQYIKGATNCQMSLSS